MRRCRRCGEGFLEWINSYHPYCPDCAYSRQLDVELRQVTDADSPYATAVLGQLTHWMAEAQRLELIPGGQSDDREDRQT